MKKLIIMSIMFIFVLVGCGEKVEFTTKEYKEKLLEKVYDKDEKAVKKYEEIKEKLEEQMKKGKEGAVKELDKWGNVETNFQVKNMMGISEETKKAVAEMRKKEGNGW